MEGEERAPGARLELHALICDDGMRRAETGDPSGKKVVGCRLSYDVRDGDGLCPPGERHVEGTQSPPCGPGSPPR